MNDKIMVTKSSMPSLEEYVEEIKTIWESHWLTNIGEKHQKLEQQLIEYLDVKNLSLFTNGHLALELAIQGMNLSGEVITTPYTFASTTHAIVRNGLKPVFCDIREDDYTIDTSKIESLITDKTSAIIPVHVYGNICDLKEIDRIAKKYDLKVIYDAAHAFGVRVNGVGIGNFGDASMFSFHATKVFNTIEGGAISFNNLEFGRKLYELKNFGIKSEEIVDGIGSNAKMNEFQAAMGLCNLRHIDEEIGKRKKVVETYCTRLLNVDGIKFYQQADDIDSNYAYFPIIIDYNEYGKTRNEVYELLKCNNIIARKYFYPLTNTFDCYHKEFDVSNTPVAQYIAKRVLTLPVYASLELDSVNRICDILIGKY